MSKKTTAFDFAISLRTDNWKALSLIAAILKGDIKDVKEIINSTESSEERVKIVKSIMIQANKYCEAKYDENALLELAGRNAELDGGIIKLLLRVFLSEAKGTRKYKLDLPRNQKSDLSPNSETESVENNADSYNIKIESPQPVYVMGADSIGDNI